MLLYVSRVDPKSERESKRWDGGKAINSAICCLCNHQLGGVAPISSLREDQVIKHVLVVTQDLILLESNLKNTHIYSIVLTCRSSQTNQDASKRGSNWWVRLWRK